MIDEVELLELEEEAVRLKDELEDVADKLVEIEPLTDGEAMPSVVGLAVISGLAVLRAVGGAFGLGCGVAMPSGPITTGG